MFDELTGLNNGKYLETEYDNYLNNHENANFVMIDFSNFKKINDTYGHDAGDKCLKSFAEKLTIFFRDSMLIRLHGDEFCIVTFHDDNSIAQLLGLIEVKIDLEVESGILPLKFGFSAGGAKASLDLEETQAKADYMMYYNKKHKDSSNDVYPYQPFDEEIYKNKLEEDKILEGLINKLNTESFSYYGRDLFDNTDKEVNYTQIYTKDINGDNLLGGEVYLVLRKNFQISRFDMFNLQNLIGRISMIDTNRKYLVSMDYRSLLSVKELMKFLDFIKKSTTNGINNIILSIDLAGIETTEYKIAIEMIKLLSSVGFKIKLDKIDNKIADYLIETINPNYIKLSTNMWKNIIGNDKQTKLLESKINTYTMMGDDLSLIFEQIETEEEKNFLHEICPSDTLYSGDSYSKERKLKLY